MTLYTWARLPTGTYDLPGPAVVTSPWVLETRERRPRRAGFTRVTRSRQWPEVRTARNVIADYADPCDVMVVGADHPADLDAHALRDANPGSMRASGVHWVVGSMFDDPATETFHDQVHRAGRLLLLTGDLRTYWSATDAGYILRFDQLFPGGAWAAWVPLLAHLYDDGVGTRPASGWG